MFQSQADICSIKISFSETCFSFVLLASSFDQFSTEHMEGVKIKSVHIKEKGGFLKGLGETGKRKGCNSGKERTIFEIAMERK